MWEWYTSLITFEVDSLMFAYSLDELKRNPDCHIHNDSCMEETKRKRNSPQD